MLDRARQCSTAPSRIRYGINPRAPGSRDRGGAARSPGPVSVRCCPPACPAQRPRRRTSGSATPAGWPSAGGGGPAARATAARSVARCSSRISSRPGAAKLRDSCCSISSHGSSRVLDRLTRRHSRRAVVVIHAARLSGSRTRSIDSNNRNHVVCMTSAASSVPSRNDHVITATSRRNRATSSSHARASPARARSTRSTSSAATSHPSWWSTGSTCAAGQGRLSPLRTERGRWNQSRHDLMSLIPGCARAVRSDHVADDREEAAPALLRGSTSSGQRDQPVAGGPSRAR